MKKNKEVYLVAVDVMGCIREPYPSFPNVEEARQEYEKYDLEINENCGKDSRIKSAIHALCGQKHWPRTVPYVKSDAGTAPDRSCHPDRCDCEALDFLIKRHPHAIK